MREDGSSANVGLAPQPGTRTPTRSRTRFETLYRTIRERICILEYRPGLKLSETALARDFGVSRTPIRRVLSRLEADGLVDSRHGSGTFVTTVDGDLLKELYDVRIRLAESIGDMAFHFPDGAAMARLHDIGQACAGLLATRDGAAFARLNMAYLNELMDCVGNRPFREIWEKLYFRTARIWIQAAPEMDWNEEVTSFRDEIADVVAALDAGDARGVGLVCRNYLSLSYARLRRRTVPVRA